MLIQNEEEGVKMPYGLKDKDFDKIQKQKTKFSQATWRKRDLRGSGRKHAEE